MAFPSCGRLLAGALPLLFGCMPPPSLGPVAVPHDGNVLRLSGGWARAPGHQAFTVDGTMTAGDRGFAIEAGLVYTALEAPASLAEASGFDGTIHGIWPVLRPTLRLGPWSLSVNAAGLVMGAGGGGFAFGWAGGTIGIGGRRWSIYAGGLIYGLDTLGGYDLSTKQLGLGGQAFWDLDGALVGASVEIMYTDYDFAQDAADEIEAAPPVSARARLVMLVLKLGMGWFLAS